MLTHSSPPSPTGDWRGIFFRRGHVALRTAVIIDYQNVHLTGHEIFRGKDQPAHLSLIHPGHFARQLIARRNQRQDSEANHAELGQVEVFRGLPDSDFDSADNARNLAQKARWEQDPLVMVTHRPLRYTFRRDASGRRAEDVNGRPIPTGEKEEKGIDVLCALAVVRYAVNNSFDLVILASADTDLTPALDEAMRIGTNKVETCRWFDKEQRRTFGQHRTERRLWNVRMDKQNWDRSQDPHKYP